MQRYTVYFIWKLHVSGGTSTHHQERKKPYLQHLVFIRPLLLPADILEEMELQSRAQLRNRLTTHFSERIPVVKRRISVHFIPLLYVYKQTNRCSSKTISLSKS